MEYSKGRIIIIIIKNSKYIILPSGNKAKMESIMINKIIYN